MPDGGRPDVVLAAEEESESRRLGAIEVPVLSYPVGLRPESGKHRSVGLGVVYGSGLHHHKHLRESLEYRLENAGPFLLERIRYRSSQAVGRGLDLRFFFFRRGSIAVQVVQVWNFIVQVR